MSQFYVPVDLGHTALLLSDIQNQIIARFSAEDSSKYLSNILSLVQKFRNEASRRRQLSTSGRTKPANLYDGVPLIIHHVLPFGINSNAFVSPYNKLSRWVKSLESSGFFDTAPSDPNHPHYAIPEILKPPEGWGSKDEIILQKLQPGCFSSSDLLAYFRARGIRHVVLCGLTTMGSVLGSARLGADLDFHIIIPKEGVMDDDQDVNDFLLEKVLVKFVDVVDLSDVFELIEASA
ncbi:Isochorismatase hydrolase [Stipitochalara longipes BDJ]|nr:Isochorismatase hydrolase [Stipitochalara longipes BDJ]